MPATARALRFLAAVWLVVQPGAALGLGAAPDSGNPDAQSLQGPAAADAPEPVLQRLARAWAHPARSLGERAARVRREAWAAGLRDLDVAARAALLERSLGSGVERAEAAVALAPRLPAAHAALAWARLRERHDLAGALAAGWRALRSLPGHYEAWLWVVANGALLACWALAAAGLLAISGLGLRHARRAAHDLGDALGGALPAVARAGLLAALCLAPGLLGGGPIAIAAALLVIALLYGTPFERLAAGLAAALALFALYPLAGSAARLLEAAGRDPVALAVFDAERGVPSSRDRFLLARAASYDALAREALALDRVHNGRMDEAGRLLERALDAPEVGARALNNAANAHLRRGDVTGAIELYQRALEREPASAAIWFNLAQAYGQAIDVTRHDEALSHAQQLDEEAVREFTEQLGRNRGPFVVDLPIRARELAARTVSGPAPRVAAALRRPLAPGRFGSSAPLGLALFVAAALAGGVGARRLERSTCCRRCGTRLCCRCGTAEAQAELCPACAQVFHPGPAVDAHLRAKHMERVRRHERVQARRDLVLALLVPGAAGIQSGRPLRGVSALTAFALAAAFALGRHGAVADPLAAGAAGPLLFGLTASGLGFAYLLLTANAGAPRRD